MCIMISSIKGVLPAVHVKNKTTIIKGRGFMTNLVADWLG